MKGDNIEKMRAKRAKDLQEDIAMLKEGICPWTKQPCGPMKEGLVQMVPEQKTLDEYHNQ